MAPCGDISWREGLPVLIRGGFVPGACWRRAEVWRQPQERLPSLLSKAAENLAAAVDEGDLRASIDVLKAVGLYGDGRMNAIFEQDPEQLIRQQAESQVDREGVPRNALLAAMAENLDNAAWRHRLAEVEAEIRRAYLDELPLREHPTATRPNEDVPNRHAGLDDCRRGRCRDPHEPFMDQQNGTRDRRQ